MPLARQLIPHHTKLRFMAYARLAAIVSAVLILGTIGWLATRGLNLGIDFAGGILIEIRTPEAVELTEIRPLLDNPAYGDTSLQHFGDKREVLMRLEGGAQTEQASLVEDVKGALGAALGEDIVYRRVDYVGPTIGEEMLESGLMALGFAFAGMLLYVWIRFEWQFGIGALLALMHDALLTIGFYGVLGLEFGLSAIAALLTVIGYSINDSVVIYDRIRENLRKHTSKPLDEIIDLSLNQTLSRTIFTGVTTLLAAGTLAVLGGEIIRGFALALCFGVVIGTYSSIYIAAPSLRLFRVSRETFTGSEAATA